MKQEKTGAKRKDAEASLRASPYRQLKGISTISNVWDCALFMEEGYLKKKTIKLGSSASQLGVNTILCYILLFISWP